MVISIRPFNKDSPSDVSSFRSITNQWIMPFLEDMDIKMIEDPYGVIVEQLGGYLFVGEDIINGADTPTIVGVVGMIKVSTEVYEMVKLGVDQSAQGKGVGRKLAIHCIEKARELNAKKLALESHSSLKAAIKIYESLGFVKIEGNTHFETADMKMEFIFTN